MVSFCNAVMFPKEFWLIGWLFWFNGSFGQSLRFSVNIEWSAREGEKEKRNERREKKTSKQPQGSRVRAYCKHSRPFPC